MPRALPSPAGRAITVAPVTPRSIAMIGYVTVGTNDLDRAAKFYDVLLAAVGDQRESRAEKRVTASAWRSRDSSTGRCRRRPAPGRLRPENPVPGAGSGSTRTPVPARSAPCPI